MLKTEMEEVSYLNKGYDKVVVNFIKIKTVCFRYHVSFFSKSKLYKYIKASCIEKTLDALSA